ncbi:MAG: bifunctional nuclease family protein [Actinobacteria bacterium]|nr:bifunctional nuclease family protein [Actinomycetota bacterium]
MVRVKLQAVRVDFQSSTPVLFLQEVDAPKRSLLVFIGAPEATAIAYALQDVEVPRPMTHDLLAQVMDLAGIRLNAIVITELKDGTYFAELQIELNDEAQAISARPSDAVALAVRTGAALFVSDQLMDAEGAQIDLDDDDDDDDEEEEIPEVLVDEFMEFLDTVRPEDFSS